MSDVQNIPIDKIRIVNPRGRNKKRFAAFSENIATVGLKKPVSVRRRTDVPDSFDLVCGQGRLEAYLANGQTEVPALVLDVTAEDGYLMSLVENIARRKPCTLDFVAKIVRLQEKGYSHAEIARKVGMSEPYTRGLLRLHQEGEERLVRAVGRGDIPIAVAVEIAAANDKDVQRCLADAYERGLLRGKALTRARNLVEARQARGPRMGQTSASKERKRLSADSLVRIYERETQKQEIFMRKARVCEQRLLFLTESLRTLLEDESFVTLLRAESLDKIPEQVVVHLGKKAS